MSQLEIEDEVATDLQRATGTADAGAADSTRLNRVLQLTGLHACSDNAPSVCISSPIVQVYQGVQARWCAALPATAAALAGLD